MRPVRGRASRRELDAEVPAGDIAQHSAAENAGQRKVELQLQLFAQVQGRASATAAEMIAARVARGHLKNGRDRRRQRIERGERQRDPCRCLTATAFPTAGRQDWWGFGRGPGLLITATTSVAASGCAVGEASDVGNRNRKAVTTLRRRTIGHELFLEMVAVTDVTSVTARPAKLSGLWDEWRRICDRSTHETKAFLIVLAMRASLRHSRGSLRAATSHDWHAVDQHFCPETLENQAVSPDRRTTPDEQLHSDVTTVSV